MDVKCKLVERTNKQGVKYVCLVINLTDNYEKLVFLTQAEKELLIVTNRK